jgi:di/tricarboxylate transporter
MFATFGRVLRALMLQVTGFLFLVIAVMLGSKAFREYQVYVTTHSSASRFYLAAFFCLLFTYFGLSSFWRSSK